MARAKPDGSGWELTDDDVAEITGNLESDIPMAKLFGPAPQPTPPKVEIELTEGGFGTLLVDGKDLGSMVTDMALFARPGQRTKVIVELSAAAALKAGTGQVLIGDETAALLVGLGWTPPAVKDGVAQERNDVQESSHGGTPTEPGAPESAG